MLEPTKPKPRKVCADNFSDNKLESGPSNNSVLPKIAKNCEYGVIALWLIIAGVLNYSNRLEFYALYGTQGCIVLSTTVVTTPLWIWLANALKINTIRSFAYLYLFCIDFRVCKELDSFFFFGTSSLYSSFFLFILIDTYILSFCWSIYYSN